MTAKAKPRRTPGDDDILLLPPEIWMEILTRLPVKSVLQCKCVCKSWYSLIASPNFISHHITNLHDDNGNHVLLQHQDVDSGVLSFSSHDESCIESSEHDDDCNDHFLGRDLGIVGSCNGLICLYGYDWKPAINDVATANFLIWNPVVRKIVEVPPLRYCSRTQHASLVGFGFDPNTGDYKVLCNLRNSAREDSDCEIFDLSKGVWRRSIIPLVPLRIVRYPEAECYVNGAVHWSVSRRVKGIGGVILSFSMSDESFREIKMPDCAEFSRSGDDDRIKTRCVTFGGLVHVIAWKIKRDDYVVDVYEGCSVWAMKEYGVAESWTKVYNIDLRSAQVLPSTQLRPRNFILWEKGEVLMVHHLQVDDVEDIHYKQDLVLYNTGSRESKRLFSITKCVQGLCQYKESLVLM